MGGEGKGLYPVGAADHVPSGPCKFPGLTSKATLQVHGPSVPAGWLCILMLCQLKLSAVFRLDSVAFTPGHLGPRFRKNSNLAPVRA